MGDPTVCFKSAPYQKALDNLEALGFNVSSRMGTTFEGTYHCDGDMFIDMTSNPGASCNRGSLCWISDSGKAYLAYKQAALPAGIRAVLGLSVGTTPLEKLMYSSLEELYECAVNNDKACVNEVKEKVREGRARIASDEAEKAKKAEEEKKLKAERTVAAEKSQVDQLVNLGDRIWAQAALILKLAKEQDGGPGGIDPDEIKDIIDSYQATKPSWRPATVQEALHYKNQAATMLKAILSTSSAYKTIEERESSSGCSAQKGTTPAPSSCPGWREEPYEGRYMYVSCDDVDISTTVTIYSSGCSKPEDKDDDKLDRPSANEIKMLR